MAPRRAQRSRKVCAFQVKKPTGRTAVRLRRLPSTRQKTGSRAGAGRLLLWCAEGARFGSMDLADDIVRRHCQTNRQQKPIGDLKIIMPACCNQAGHVGSWVGLPMPAYGPLVVTN